MDFLNENRIPLPNCRGQSYDKFSEYQLKARARCPDSDYCVVICEKA